MLKVIEFQSAPSLLNLSHLNIFAMDFCKRVTFGSCAEKEEQRSSINYQHFLTDFDVIIGRKLNIIFDKLKSEKII